MNLTGCSHLWLSELQLVFQMVTCHLGLYRSEMKAVTTLESSCKWIIRAAWKIRKFNQREKEQHYKKPCMFVKKK